MKISLLTKVSAVSVAFVVLMTVELLWWSNARSSYPDLFVTELPALPADEYVIPALREKCGDALEISPGAGEVLIRCGTFWPFRTVWAVSKHQTLEGANP